jgi:hypothetical protein
MVLSELFKAPAQQISRLLPRRAAVRHPRCALLCVRSAASPLLARVSGDKPPSPSSPHPDRLLRERIRKSRSNQDLPNYEEWGSVWGEELVAADRCGGRARGALVRLRLRRSVDSVAVTVSVLVAVWWGDTSRMLLRVLLFAAIFRRAEQQAAARAVCSRQLLSKFPWSKT